MATKQFDKAKQQKADEFYTRLEDIELELRNYKSFFKNKIILCNCDDPYESNFFKYFAMNFNHFELKKLIAIGYNLSPIAGKEINVFNIMDDTSGKSNAFKIEITETPDFNLDGAVELNDIKLLLEDNKNVLTKLKENGDFRSKESIDLLKEADIVVTNPPFSLFRGFVEQLEEYKKDFIIIGNTNALSYKEIFRMFKENKIRTGYTNFNKGMFFMVPEHYKKYTKKVNNIKYVRVSNSCWFTSLPVRKHQETLTLYRKYDEKKFPKYVNYNAINVDTWRDIPSDYDGEIGVPITFLDKYNPEQFEIIALGITGSIDFSNERRMEILNKGEPTGQFTINAKGTLYRKWNSAKDKKAPAFRDVETGELYQSIYARVIIKKKKEQKSCE